VSQPRVIGGRARGRALETPKRGTRPTPSRVREAMFDVLAFAPRGLFLDLFAGSGALGLEAASRGWHAVCVDLAREAAEVIRRNARALGLEVEVRRGDAVAVARELRGRVDVCSAAPPYPADLPTIFQALLDTSCVRPGGRYVFQHPSALALDLTLEGRPAPVERRAYGSNALTWVRVPGEAADDAAGGAAGVARGPEDAHDAC
jgi:16S rRNA (guanine(966)-N(2))-methyltransferase RsmD